MDINKIREVIHADLVENVFVDRGGANFSRLRGSDVRRAFALYDQLVFDNQIDERLQHLDSSLVFHAVPNQTGVGGFCGVKRKHTFRPPLFVPKCEYYLSIAPNIISKLYAEEREGLEHLVGVECSDRTYCLMFVLEHQIIHLLLLLWKFLDKGPKETYGEHGSLFWCMLKHYFNHSPPPKPLELSKVKHQKEEHWRSPSPLIRKGDEPGLLTYWENSCYMDSLIVSLFMGASDYYRRGIFDVDVDDIPYRPELICSEKSRINTEDRVRELAKELQQQLLEDYSKIIEGKENFYCSDIRRLLRRCFPDIRSRRGYVQFNVSQIYDLLTEFFPAMKMYFIPKFGGDLRRSQPLSLIQMWDLMDPETKIDWDDVKSEVLAFQNSLIPPIRNYDTLEDESVVVYGPIPGKFTVVTRNGKKVRVPQMGRMRKTATKSRAFGEYILDGRYRLFASIVVHGRRPASLSDWGGGHYTAYIRPFTDQDAWYHYNDVGPQWRKTQNGKLPRKAFYDGGRSRPELLFYQKIKIKTSTWEGTNITIKTIPRDDGYVFVTVNGLTLKDVEGIEPEFTTEIMKNKTYTWRVRPRMVRSLVRKLKKMD